MREKGRFERYFSRKDTILAKSLRKISPEVGIKYRNSRTKRISDTALALSFTALYAPLASIVKWRVKHEDGLDPIYRQQRVSRRSVNPDREYETFEIRKIRSMRVGSDTKDVYGMNKYTKDNDPRLLKSGKFSRSRRIDEYPQLRQVLKGEMSFVGIRPIHPFEWDKMKKNVGDEFRAWEQAYFEGKPGYGSLYRVQEWDYAYQKKIYWDTRYAREANLGMDLYIAYNAFLNLLHGKRK